MIECIFCKISAGVVPSDTIFEDAEVKVFRDIQPKAPVHLLVVPKTHIQSIDHLENGHAALVVRMIDAARSAARAEGLDGYKLVFNVGRGGGQVIDHLHLHVLGGWQKGEDHKAEV